MSEEIPDSRAAGASGRKVVWGLLAVVLILSGSAAWYGYSLRSDTPHDESDHPDAQADQSAESSEDSGVITDEQQAEHMRAIGYVQ